MRFSIWPLFGLFLFSLPVYAVQKIFAQSVEYCSTEQIILVQKANLIFYPANASVTFDIVANSVQNNVDAAVSFALVAYGMTPIQYSIDLCSIAGGLLCPLPAYQFNGSASYFIPRQYLKEIPSIAFTVPDLEAKATIRITDTSTASQVACLEVFLSNGLTTRHAYVSWAVGAILIIATLIALIHPFFPLAKSRSAPDYRLLTLVGWVQFMALTGMISVEYPQALLSFAQNFAFSWGLIGIAPLQGSLTSTAASTGADLNTTQSAIQVSNSISSGDIAALSSGAYSIPSVVTASAQNAPSGLERFLKELGFFPANAFANALVVFLILAAILIALTLLFGAIFGGMRTKSARQVVKRENEKNGSEDEKTVDQSKPKLNPMFIDYAALNALRFFLIAVFPLLTLAIYTFKQGSNAGSAFMAVAAIFFVLILVGAVVLGLSIRSSAKNHPDGADGLYEDQNYRRRLGALFHHFKRDRSWFAIFLASAMLLRAIFVGAAQRSPYAQIIPLIIIEASIFLAIIFSRPHSSRGSNVLDAFLALLRMVCFGLLIAFLPNLGVNRIVVTVLGFVIIAIQGIGFLILTIILLIHTITGLIWFFRVRPDRAQEKIAFKKSKADKKPVSALQLSNTSTARQDPASAASNRSSATLIDPNYPQHSKHSPDMSHSTSQPWPFVPAQGSFSTNHQSAAPSAPGAPPLPPGAIRRASSFGIPYNASSVGARSESFFEPVAQEVRPSSMYQSTLPQPSPGRTIAQQDSPQFSPSSRYLTPDPAFDHNDSPRTPQQYSPMQQRLRPHESPRLASPLTPSRYPLPASPSPPTHAL